MAPDKLIAASLMLLHHNVCYPNINVAVLADASLPRNRNTMGLAEGCQAFVKELP